MYEQERKYYNERLKVEGMPDFEELYIDEVKKFRGTLSFAQWQLQEAAKDLRNGVKDLIQPIWK